MEHKLAEWAGMWLQNHGQLVQGMVWGYAASHPAMLMRWAWQLAVKIPVVRQILLSNPEGTKAFAKALVDEFNKDVDTEAATEAAAAKTAPSADAPKPA